MYLYIVIKNKVIEAIITLAIECKKEDSFYALIEAHIGLPKLVEMIVYELFLNGFNPYQSKLFNSYEIVKEYANELRANGEVIFERHQPKVIW